MLEKLNPNDFPQIFALMAESFPKDEYRPYQEQKALMEKLEYQKLTLDNDTFENTGKSRFFERRTSRVLY